MTGSSKLGVYVLAGLVLSGGLFAFAVKPVLDRVSAQVQEETAVRSQLLILEQQILAYKTAQSDLSKAENKELLYEFIVDDKNLYIPIEEMENAAKITGSGYELKIKRNFLKEPAPESGRRPTARTEEQAVRVTSQTQLEEVPYTLTIRNPSYTQIVNFFDYLENIPHFTELSSVTLSLQDNPSTNRSEITAVIDGVFLVKKDPNDN